MAKGAIFRDSDLPMSIASVLFAPLMLLVPLGTGLEAGDGDGLASIRPGIAPDGLDAKVVPDPADDWSAIFSTFDRAAATFRDQPANQVRIEQRVTIRIAPRPAPATRNMLMDLPRGAMAPHLVERKIGKCLPIAGIAGVQADQDNKLLLFMRDRRIVSAALERSCRSRDFYSGFYLSRSRDGQLCVDRDTLLSRSGANCKLTRIRQLVEDDD